VIGSFHSALRRTEDQTERYLAALRNQSIHILGHPQGRIFNHRDGLEADWPRVFAEAARLDKAIEIDGYPDRQDLKLSLLRLVTVKRFRQSDARRLQANILISLSDQVSSLVFRLVLPLSSISTFSRLILIRRS
jgi:hypothetical protein